VEVMALGKKSEVKKVCARKTEASRPSFDKPTSGGKYRRCGIRGDCPDCIQFGFLRKAVQEKRSLGAAR